jgi:hypothetical protein
MARDVDFNVTASDKTGPALSAAARNFAKAQDKMKQDAEKAFGGLGRGLIATANLAGPKIGAAVTKGIASAAQLAGPLLAGAAAYAAPLIGATLSAAIIGGAGIGGVVGGVMLAARDPRVQAAGKTLGDNVMKSLTEAAEPFIGPVLTSIDKISSGFQAVEGNIKRIFANSAKFVGPLTDGVIAFGQGLVRGFDKLIAKAGPVIAEISTGLTELGADIEDMFDTIAGGSEGAATAMRSLFDTIQGGVVVLGPLLRGLTEIYNISNKIAPGLLTLAGRFQDMTSGTGELTAAVASTVAQVTSADQAATNYATTLAAVAEATRAVIGENNSLYGSQTAAAQAYRDATAAVKENGQTVSLNSAAGIKNREVLQGLATKLNSAYDAYVKVNGAGQGANEVLIKNRENFVAVATKATGSARAANALADALVGIPDRRPKIELLDNATHKVNNVINRLAAVHSKTVTLNIAVRQSGDAAALRKQTGATDAFSASQYSAGVAATGGAVHRVGGPRPVSVESTVNVLLDGEPFRRATVTVVRDAEKRAAWRDRVGVR